MKRNSVRMSVVVCVLVATVLGLGLVVGAQQGFEASGVVDPEAAPQGQVVPSVIGDDPDEDGYTGPLPQGTAPGDPSGVGWAEGASGPEPLVPGPDSDVLSVVPQAWSSFYYVYAAGSTLKPRNSSQTWASSGDGGCAYVNRDAYEVLNLHLDLPTGALIEYLRIYYYDTSAANSMAWVTTYDGAGDVTDRAFVQSGGTAGYGTAVSSQIAHVVDNASYSYVLNWRPSQIGSTMWLCGLRVAYRLPLP